VSTERTAASHPLVYEPPAGIRRLEAAVALVLRVGVAISSALILVGTVMTVTASSTAREARRTVAALRAGAAHPAGLAIPRTAGDVFHGLRHAQGPDIVILGVVLLVLTPIARVAVSMFVYLYERDATFVVITAVVLTLLLTSFALG